MLSKYVRNHSYSHGDRENNGRVAKEDDHVIFENPDGIITIQGIENCKIDSILLVTAGGVSKMTCGEVIIIMNQHAYGRKGKTTDFSGQIEHFKNKVDDCSMKVLEENNT